MTDPDVPGHGNRAVDPPAEDLVGDVAIEVFQAKRAQSECQRVLWQVLVVMVFCDRAVVFAYLASSGRFLSPNVEPPEQYHLLDLLVERRNLRLHKKVIHYQIAALALVDSADVALQGW